uniref:Uncharacterized protein n=1 Tax=Rhizophora mucronata TaxID=61149 RepID=A0A2P2K7Z6_RHIMU
MYQYLNPISGICCNLSSDGSRSLWNEHYKNKTCCVPYIECTDR